MTKRRLLTLIVALTMVTALFGGQTFAEEPGWNAAKTMYYDSEGNPVHGVQKISGTLYFFNESTGIAAKKGFFRDRSGNEYYAVNNSGKLATGWKAYKRGKKKKLNGYYFSKTNGRMAKNTRVGHLKIPKNGRLHKAYAYGIRTLNKKGWSLKAAYNYSCRLRYYGQSYRVQGANKSERYSLRGFREKRGNCFVMASTFYIMAKLLGYNVRQVSGAVGAPHSWTEIRQNGKIRVCDPDFQHETGRNGYKVYYGQRGTWRYAKMANLNKFVKKGKFK